MKSTTYLLAATAMLSLGLSVAANADNHRRHDHRDGSRHQPSAAQHRDHKHRAPHRNARRDNKRHQERRSHRRDSKHHRRDERRSAWRTGQFWRGTKYARQHRRQHRRARQHQRALQRSHYRAARRHWHENHPCYTDHGYERRALTFWLDDIGLSLRNSR